MQGKPKWKRRIRNGALTGCIVGLIGLFGPALMVDDTVMGLWAMAPFAGVLALIAGGLGVYFTMQGQQHEAALGPEVMAHLQATGGRKLKHFVPEIVGSLLGVVATAGGAFAIGADTSFFVMCAPLGAIAGLVTGSIIAQQPITCKGCGWRTPVAGIVPVQGVCPSCQCQVFQFVHSEKGGQAGKRMLYTWTAVTTGARLASLAHLPIGQIARTLVPGT